MRDGQEILLQQKLYIEMMKCKFHLKYKIFQTY